MNFTEIAVYDVFCYQGIRISSAVVARCPSARLPNVSSRQVDVQQDRVPGVSLQHYTRLAILMLN
jgi:hypothetical protein